MKQISGDKILRIRRSSEGRESMIASHHLWRHSSFPQTRLASTVTWSVTPEDYVGGDSTKDESRDHSPSRMGGTGNRVQSKMESMVEMRLKTTWLACWKVSKSPMPRMICWCLFNGKTCTSAPIQVGTSRISLPHALTAYRTTNCNKWPYFCTWIKYYFIVLAHLL